MKINELNAKILNHELDEKIVDLYEDQDLLEYQRNRYLNTLNKFSEYYNDEEVVIYSAAGRSEIGGNHTDHQHGQVLAASINLDGIAVVTKQERYVDVVSDDRKIERIDIEDLEKREAELSTSESLIRGVLFGLKRDGYKLGGFKAYITSDVLIGAGLSSSASFEVLIGTIISGLYNDNKIDNVTIAKIGQFAENVYFGKPCGLMDQCACAVGGLINIDFKDPTKPVVKHLDVDFSKYGYSLCIVDTKGDHSDLTCEYASVPIEMKEVAHYFNQEYLRDVNPYDFYANIANLRTKVNDRAILRAHHYFNEHERVSKLVNALNTDDFESFKTYIEESGNSSYRYLQNVFASSDPLNQAVSLGLAISEMNLKGHGVCRVHGGGFAGTIQAFVENDYVKTYQETIEKVFGVGTCHILKIRKYGGLEVIR